MKISSQNWELHINNKNDDEKNRVPKETKAVWITACAPKNHENLSISVKIN